MAPKADFTGCYLYFQSDFFKTKTKYRGDPDFRPCVGGSGPAYLLRKLIIEAILKRKANGQSNRS